MKSNNKHGVLDEVKPGVPDEGTPGATDEITPGVPVVCTFGAPLSWRSRRSLGNRGYVTLLDMTDGVTLSVTHGVTDVE